VAAVFLGQALQINNGNGHPEAWPYVFATLFTVALAALSPPWPTVEAAGDQVAVLVLGVGLALQFSQLLTSPRVLRPPHPGVQEFFAILAAAAVVAGGALARRPALGPYQGPAMVLLFALAGWWMIRASYPPHIDVFVFQQEASRALAHGRNPYALTFPNIYGNMQFYGPGIADAKTVFMGFPYFPLSLLLAFPGWLIAGDFRVAQLAACTITAAAFAGFGPSRLPLLASALLLFTPRMFFVLEQGWTEPFGVALLALVTLAAARRSRWLPVALGLLLAWKQYTVLFLPLAALLVPRPFRWRAYARLVLPAVALAALITLPFFLWNPSAFWKSVVLAQFAQPFRTEALSLPAWWVVEKKLPEFDVLPGMLAGTLAAMVAVLARGRRGPAAFVTGSALVYAVFIALSKQSFCNYWWFVLGTMCCGIAASVVPEAPSPSSRADRSPSAPCTPELEHRRLPGEHHVHRRITPPRPHLGQGARPFLVGPEPRHRALHPGPLLGGELVLRRLQRTKRLLQRGPTGPGARPRHLGGQRLQGLDLRRREPCVNPHRLGALRPLAQPRVGLLEHPRPTVHRLGQPPDLARGGHRLAPQQPLVGQEAIELGHAQLQAGIRAGRHRRDRSSIGRRPPGLRPPARGRPQGQQCRRHERGSTHRPPFCHTH
jgi:hypothetical protein